MKPMNIMMIITKIVQHKKAKCCYYLMEEYELDNSWLETLKETEEKYNLFYKETQESIDIHSFFIKNNEIIRVSKDKILLDDGVLKRDDLIYHIKNNRKLNDTVYKLKSILKYNLTLEPEEVLNEYWGDEYLVEERNMSDIIFSKTISIFRDINCLFILFNYPTSRNRNTKKIYITNTGYRKTRRRR